MPFEYILWPIVENIDIIGFTYCGGCPAKKAVLWARDW